MTGASNVPSAMTVTEYGFGDKKKNCGTELHKNNLNKGMNIDNTLYANGFGRTKAAVFDGLRICMLVSEDLFDAVGVKNFMGDTKNKTDLIGDLVAIVGTLGSMDCRKHIDASVKTALVLKHHTWIKEVSDATSFVLSLDRTVKRTGTKAQALEAMTQAFFNF